MDIIEVAFLYEAEHGEWCCSNCTRNYHSFSSLTQHLRRVHQVSAFVTDCQTCRELFENRRAYNSHLRKCSMAVPSGAWLHRCGACGAQYHRQESLELHEGCCVRQGTTPQTSPSASAYDGQYCGKPWPNRMSLAQHIRNRHMADSQRDRNREVVVAAPTRQLWTEERREAFLDIADRVGWSSHSLIASRLGMTIRQIRNYKIKFPRSRWQDPPVASGDDEEAVASSPGSRSGTSGVSLSPSPADVPDPDDLPATRTSGVSLSHSPPPLSVS